MHTVPEKEELAGGDSRGWVFTGAGETRGSKLRASGKAGLVGDIIVQWDEWDSTGEGS
jgi:hypothetical protein